MQCQFCDNRATVHLTEILDGQKIERHMCEQCAQSEGITVKTSSPISAIINDLVGTQHEAKELVNPSFHQ